MKKLGKEISKGNGRSFLEQTTDNSYEEKTMRGIVIGLLKTESYEEFLMYCDDFVQRIEQLGGLRRLLCKFKADEKV